MLTKFLPFMTNQDDKKKNEEERFNAMTKDQVKKLVEVRNLPEFIEKFEMNKTIPHKLSKIWKEVAERAGLDFSGAKCKEKYNNLMKEYRKNIIISKTSGQGKISWKYWDLMNETVVEGKELVPTSAKCSHLSVDEQVMEVVNVSEKENSGFTGSPRKKLKKDETIDQLISMMNKKNDLLAEIITKNNEIKNETMQNQLITKKIETLEGQNSTMANDIEVIKKGQAETNLLLSKIIETIQKKKEND